MEIKRKSSDGLRASQDVHPSLKKQKSAYELELEQLASEDTHQNWARPPLPAVDPNKDTIVFQQFEIDYTLGDPMAGMPGPASGTVPILRMYGVTEQQHSVQCNVHGFSPYFYIQALPPYNDVNQLDQMRAKLNRIMDKAVTTQGRLKEYVCRLDIVHKNSIMGYTGNQRRDFIKITMAVPKHVATLRTALESGELDGKTLMTYESNLPYVLRFMIDRAVVGCSWVEVAPGDYLIRPEAQRTSTCQLEIDVAYDSFISHEPVDEWSKLAPFRILSFDIECAGRKGVFPEPEHDPVIQIANLVTAHGSAQPFVRNVFTLKGCAPIVGVQVCSFDNEQNMLVNWKRFVAEVDPDIIIGYNIANFDFPYLINRAKVLKLDEFAMLSRLKESRVRVKETTFSSKAYGTRETHETTIDGRVQLDLIQAIQRDYKLRSYTLNSVSAHFLGEQKEEVHHSIISELQAGSDNDRRRLAVYCLKDAYLPQRLLDKLMITFNYMEMARVTGVPLSFLLSRGQQIKVVSQLYRKAQQRALLIPALKVDTSAADGDVAYEGATVIEPRKGFYAAPIATLDFMSLYPSIMMAHNLCYSTLLSPDRARSMSPDDYERTPNGDLFVRAAKQKGILPQILEDLLSARKTAKEALKRETDPFKKAVLDGRQLALKISANSVYGFTGATVGKLPCLEISSSVTAYGRQMIELTKQLVEKRFCVANNYAADATVIYGDTDSVMVKFGDDVDVSTAMELGREAAKLISQEFVRPIQLEFEKVYCPYLLINKKRYAGLLWTNPSKFDKIDAKGIETVRRDNCPLVRNVINTCLEKILIDRDIDGAQQYTRQVISDLLQNKLDLSLLVISKALSKEGKDYAAKQAHVELAERMRKRDPHTAPAIGDRVPYVIIKAAKGAKAYEKAEDPLYVLENNIPLDYQYYLEQQLKNPLSRLFEPIMDNPGTLLAGEHTRSISMPTPKQGGIMGFAVKRVACLGCKTPLSDTETVTCKSCRPREAELYQNQLALVSKFESEYARLWTQCQITQGSFHQTVLCSNRDCAIFYMRQKVKKDLQDAQDTLARFDLSW
eukprot:TRINITY_DN3727_c0_g1_i5.p1 TRINITY_DN3727_c0_g1~~TRINITY_DN3727_c0_g1_i5.p1  ORF type:complete len:1091 (+),score=398.67 TRINITY_DN3727_c0_g1_i5:80-3274(+)